MGIFKRILDAVLHGVGRRVIVTGETQPVQLTREEVDAFLATKVAEKKEPLDVVHSIVDLMKALDLDSSREARQELALDLGYDGTFDDSAAANEWLHAKVMEDLYAHKFVGD